MIERAQAQLGTATWGDLLARRHSTAERHRFVGRRYEQEQFRLNYLYEVPQVLLFVVQGPPGIGKTALLTRYREIAEEHRALTAVVDRDTLTLPREFAILQTMESLADQLAAAGTPLTTYREVCRDYLHAVRSIDADSTAPARVWNLFGGTADPDPWTQRAWETYFTRTLSLRQSALLRDPVGTLTERFIQDLNAWAVVRRMVLCFDDWEQTDPAEDPATSAASSLAAWLPTLLSRGQLSTNVWFILTTRSPLDPQWDALAPLTRTFELQPLPKKESLSLLLPAARTAPAPDGVPSRDTAGENGSPGDSLSEAEISAWVDQAKGSPLNLSLLASGRPQYSKEQPPDEAAYLNRYIDSLKPVQQAALLKCTAARGLDESTLSVLLGEDAAQEARGWFAASPVVVQPNATWRFRSILREPLVSLARARIGPAWDAAHQTLFAYYRQRMELEDRTPHYLDAPWRHDRLELLYHELVQGDEPNSIRHALLSFLEGIRRFYPWAGAVALTWQDAIRVRTLTSKPAADQGMAQQVSMLWGALVERRWEDSLSLVDALLSSKEPGAPVIVKEVKEQFIDLRNLIASRLVLPPAPEPERTGRNAGARDFGLRPVDASDAQPEPRRPNATPAAHLTPSAPSAIEPAGRTELTVIVEVPEDTTGAGTVSDQSPDSCERTEQPAASAEDLEEQRQVKAVELCSDANVHLGLGDYEAAIQGYDEALEENPDYIAAYYNRGSAYTHVGALDSAIADFTQVLQLDPSQMQAYRQRALIYARKGDYERAIRDYNAALAALENRGAAQSDPDTVNAVVYDRANAYFRLGAYEQALADYSVNVVYAPDHVEAHLNRGLTYAALGNYPEALRDFNQAIALAPHQALIYHHRGQIYARTERYTEALKDYDRALDLNPRYATVQNNRGLLYVKIEAYPQALDAYQQAMALQPDWATPYYNAACAAALTEDVEQACIWLARAIGLREAYRAMALRDPDLAAIRQHPRFRALVESTQ